MKNASIIAYGNATILALLTIVLVLLPLHGIGVIAQGIAALCGIGATVVHTLAAAHIERSDKADL